MKKVLIILLSLFFIRYSVNIYNYISISQYRNSHSLLLFCADAIIFWLLICGVSFNAYAIKRVFLKSSSFEVKIQK